MALLKELSLDAITDVVIVTGHARADSAASHALISPAKVNIRRICVSHERRARLAHGTSCTPNQSHLRGQAAVPRCP